MRVTKLRATLLHDNLSLGELSKALACDRSIIASSSASFSEERKQSSRVHLFDTTIPTFLNIVGVDKAIPIETAVRKITSVPAQRLGIKSRGMVREGYYADLVMFRDSTIETVFVNGIAAVSDGALTDSMGGRILKHTHE
jgi:N-acyl-D-amino-acid deacylase